MKKRSNRKTRASNRRSEAAIKLIALGGGFVMLPTFLGHAPLSAAFTPLRPLGLLILLAGVFFLWLNHRDKGAEGQKLGELSVYREPTFDKSPPNPVNSMATEFEYVAGQTIAAQPVPDKPTTWSSAVFDVIEWRRFEALVEALFQQAGFQTESKSHGSDGGVDIWLHSRHQPGKPVSIVQCKHWHGKKVGVDKVRELRGVMASLDINRGQYATSSTYTADAVEFARANGINPLDASGLLDLIAKRTPEQQEALLKVALDGDYWKPTCVNCGVKMVSRTPGGGGKAFWGCVNYPQCRTTMQMR